MGQLGGRVHDSRSTAGCGPVICSSHVCDDSWSWTVWSWSGLRGSRSAHDVHGWTGDGWTGRNGGYFGTNNFCLNGGTNNVCGINTRSPNVCPSILRDSSASKSTSLDFRWLPQRVLLRVHLCSLVDGHPALFPFPKKTYLEWTYHL